MKNLIQKYVSASDDVHFGQEKRWSVRIPIIIYDISSVFLFFFLFVYLAFAGIALFTIVAPMFGCIPMIFRVPGRNPVADAYVELRYFLVPVLTFVQLAPMNAYFFWSQKQIFVNIFDVLLYIFAFIVFVAMIVKFEMKKIKDEKAWNIVRYQIYPLCIAFQFYIVIRTVASLI